MCAHVLRTHTTYRAAACSHTLPLVSDAVVFFFLAWPLSTHNSPSRALGSTVSLACHEKSQDRAFATIWNARSSSCLAIPTLSNLHKQAHAQKTTFANVARTSPAVCIFGRIGISRVLENAHLYLLLHFGLYLFVSFCQKAFECLCARVSVFIFYLVGANLKR